MRKCLYPLFAVFLLMIFSSTALADIWDFEATSSNSSIISDFIITFDDADDDNIVSISDIINFSGISDSYFNYEELTALRSTVAGSLTLIATDVGFETRWAFLNAEEGAYKYLTLSEGNTLLSYNASPVPVPAAVFLLGSGIIGLASFRNRYRRS